MFPFLPFLTFPECGRRKCARRRRRRALDRELNYIHDQNLPGTSAGQLYYVSATHLEPSVLRVKYVCAVPKYSRISGPAPLELFGMTKELKSASDMVFQSPSIDYEGCEKAIDDKNAALLVEAFHPQLINSASKMVTVTSPPFSPISDEYGGIAQCVNGIAQKQNIKSNKINGMNTADNNDESSDNQMGVERVKSESDLAQPEENGGLSKLTVETVTSPSEEILALNSLVINPVKVNNGYMGSRRTTPSPADSPHSKTPQQQQVEAFAVTTKAVGTPPGVRAARARQRAFQPSQAMLEMFGGSTADDSSSTAFTSQPGPELVEPGESCEEIGVVCSEEKTNKLRTLRKKKNSQDIETVAAVVDGSDGGHQASSPNNNNVIAASKVMQLSDPGPELASDEEKEDLKEEEERPKMLNVETLEDGDDEILLKRSLNGGKEDKSAANGFHDAKEEGNSVLNEETTTDMLSQRRKSSNAEQQDESMRNGKDTYQTVENGEEERSGECGDAVPNYYHHTSTHGDNDKRTITVNTAGDNEEAEEREDRKPAEKEVANEEGVMQKPSQQRALRQHERSSISFSEAPPPENNKNNHEPATAHGQRKTAVVSPRQNQQQQQQNQRLRVQGSDKVNERLHALDTTTTAAKSRNNSGGSSGGGGKGSVLAIRHHQQQQQHTKANNSARPLAQVSPSPRRNIVDDAGGGGLAATQHQKQQLNSGSSDPTKSLRRPASPRFQKTSTGPTGGGGGRATFGGSGNATSNSSITNGSGKGDGSGMMNGTNDDDASTATGGDSGGGVAEGAILIRQANIINDDEMFVADILIENGVISRISKSLNVATDGDGVEVVEANGRWLLPAGIDAYTQFTSSATASGAAFVAGTKAALVGGTGTLIEVVRPKSGESLAAAVDRVLRLADMYAKCHFGVSALVGGEWNSQIRGQMTELVREKGVNSFLLEFTNDAHIFEALEHAKTLGAYCRVLPDNKPIVALLEKRQAATPAALATLRAERVRHFCVFSQIINAPLSVISVGGVPRAIGAAVRDSRVEGAMVSAEVALTSTDSHSTSSSSSCDDCALELLADGALTMCVSGDGGTSLTGQKPPTSSGHQPNAGNAIEMRMSALWQRGVIDAARLDPMRFVAVTSSNAAKIFNIYPQKGKVAVSSDADLVLWDFNSAVATPHLTILAGKVVARGGQYCQVEESGSLSTAAVAKGTPRAAAAQRPQWFVSLPPNSPYLFSVVQLKEKLFNLSMFSAGRSKPEQQTNASSRRTSFASSCASAPPPNDASVVPYDRKPSNASVPAAVASTNRPINVGARNRNIQSTDPPKRSATKVIYPPGGKSTSLW